MKVLVENEIHPESINPLRSLTESYGLAADFYECSISRKTSLKRIFEWAVGMDEKIIIITGMDMRSDSLSRSVYLKGVSNAIGGNTAVIKYENNERFPLIFLHEIFHLHGITHCHEAGCIMSLKLCARDVRYCVTCKLLCKPLHICKGCEEKWMRNSN
jgi:predicted Zn-dependent protease